MKVIRLTAENFKRLVAVEIEPTGRIVPITGRNAEGKTSVLDSITAALAGQSAFKLDRPIHEGEEEAVVTVDLGDLLVTRRWRADKSSLEVTLPNGAAVSSPRKVLDDLIGKLSFDPLAFAQAPAAEQRRLLLEVAGLTEEDARLQVERSRHYDARTVHNRDAKRLKAQLEGLPRPRPELSTAERIDVSAVARELSVASAETAELLRLRSQRDSINEEIAQLQQRIADLTTTIAGIRERGRELVGREPADRERELSEQLSKATLINDAVERRERREEVAGELHASEQAAKAASEEIDAVDERRQVLLSNARLPIGGLSVDDDGVLLDGIPFGQSSAAERLRTSVAMAMAMNPKLRVIRIADASLLDSVNRALIEQMAEDNDFQIWLEVVDESKSQGFVIEDGQVVHRG